MYKQKKISKLYEELNKAILHASFIANSDDSSVHNKVQSGNMMSMDDLLNKNGREIFVALRHFGTVDSNALVRPSEKGEESVHHHSFKGYNWPDNAQ